MTHKYGKVINVGYSPSGELTTFEEHAQRAPDIDWPYEPFETMRFREDRDGKKFRVNMLENALQLPDAGNLLRQDIRYLAFSQIAQMPRSFEPITFMQDSMNKNEEYLRDAAIGVIPKANSGTPAPHVISDFEGGTIIGNDLHRAIVDFPMDILRFDQLGKARQLSNELGRSAVMTLEYAVWEYLTTTSNYTRNSTTGDNNEGANQQTLTFSADGFRVASHVITSSKDRKSGNYLMYSPNVLWCSPLLEVPAKMLLTTMALSRVHGATTAEAVGTGSMNVLGDGRIDTIILSPWIGTEYEWGLCDSRANGFTMQTVEPFDVFEQSPTADNPNWFNNDALAYLVKGYFGVGFIDDRAFFFSDSTTDATVS